MLGKIDYVTLNIKINYKPTVEDGRVYSFDSIDRTFFLTEERYNKVLDILEETRLVMMR